MTPRRYQGLRGLFGMELAILGVIAGLIGLAGAQTWRLHSAQLTAADLRTELQAQSRRAAENLATAHAEALMLTAKHRAIEQAWIRKHQEIAREAENQARRTAADAGDARIAGDGLRIRAHQHAATAACPAAAATSPNAASSGPPTTSPATVLANVLERLETAGRELAAIADARGTAGAACEKAYQALLTKP
jgi:uncharacterized protein YlxW (UPF0749 family)